MREMKELSACCICLKFTLMLSLSATMQTQTLPWKGELGVALDQALLGVVQEFGKGEEVSVWVGV